jgi:iron complex outermembrane receptor protein
VRGQAANTSYFQHHFDRTQNGLAYHRYSLSSFLNSTVGGEAAPLALINAIAAFLSALYLHNQMCQVAGQFRLASKPYDAVSPWTWLGGVYFFNQHTNSVENDPIFGVNDTFARFSFSSADLTILPATFPPIMRSSAPSIPREAKLGLW